MQELNNIRGLIIDMDGVLWHGDQAQAGLTDFFCALRNLRLPFVLATNNASLTAEQYVRKLSAMGVKVSLNEILTSGMATAIYLAQHYPVTETRIFLIGMQGLLEPLQAQGFQCTGIYEVQADNRAQLVVCGLDKALNWDKLATAALNIQKGAHFIASNGDVTLPTELGFLPGNGATIAALSAATGVMPIVIGKPEPIIYQQALTILGLEPAYVVAVGDRLDTDILGAVRAGTRSLLVLSGISTKNDLAGLDYAPDWIMQDIAELTRALLQK